MRSARLLVVLCVASGCKNERIEAQRQPVVPAERAAHAPRPPPVNVSPVWQPEPAPVTAALVLRAERRSLEALEALRAAADEAKQQGDVRAQAIALHRAGDVQLDLRRCDEAEGLYLEALELHRARKDDGLIAVAANDLGLMCGSCQRDPVRWFELAVETRARLGDPAGLRKALSNLGGAVMLWRRPRDARPILEKGLALAVEQGDVEAQRKAHVNLASCLMLQAEEDKAPAWKRGAPGLRADAYGHLERAIALAKELGLGAREGACSGLVVETMAMCDALGVPR